VTARSTALEACVQRVGRDCLVLLTHVIRYGTQTNQDMVPGPMLNGLDDAGSSDIDRGPQPAAGFVTSASADMADATTNNGRDGHRDPKSLRRFTRRELLHDPVLPKLFET
jgi:hypothetical protein